jgi:5-methylcytosine-specific restriction endonuclease McrA
MAGITQELDDIAKFLIYHQCDKKCFGCFKELPELAKVQHWYPVTHGDAKEHNIVVGHVVLCNECPKEGHFSEQRCLGFDEKLRCKKQHSVGSKYCCEEHSESVSKMDAQLMDDDTEDVDRGPSDRFRGKLREAVWHKSRGRCHYCGIQLHKNNWEADHYIPVALEGPTELSNGVASCRACNRHKGATDGDDYVKQLRMFSHKN